MYGRGRTMSPRLSERHCRGHHCPSRHTLCWLHPGCASLGLLNPFFHSLSETLFIFLLSFLRRVTRTRSEGATRADGYRDAAVSPFALSTVISLKSNCTRKNGSPLSGKRIAQLEGGRLNCALVYISSVGENNFSVMKITFILYKKYTDILVVKQYRIHKGRGQTYIMCQ